jgi:hypothetical protein
MIRLNFICEFKSDIVLHSSSNTEGKVDIFDYIAGSNFLGMVARDYKSFCKDAFEVFHSGSVRFGDAHIVKDNEKTFKVPFSWFAPKGVGLDKALKNKELYNEYFLTKDEYDRFIQDNKQLKQQRVGYITKSGELAKIKHNYRQKSAYDKSNRKSKDSSMFGYYSLPKGTKWAFSVEMDSDTHKEKIIELLEKSKRLGKSRSAEYGRVKISLDENNTTFFEQDLNPIKIDGKYYIFLYAQSRLALTNNGINSYRFDLESLNLGKNEKIAWDKSHIRTTRYTPYISIRDNRDPERLIIDKGSVIAIEVKENFDVSFYSKSIEKGLGLFLSEGHGKVVINPTFLTTKQPKFNKSNSNNQESKKNSFNKGIISKWLKEQQEKEKRNYELLKSVKEFIKEHKKDIKNKKSQWGQIRSLCSANTTSQKIYEALFSQELVNNHPKGFLLHGQAKEKWSYSLINALRDKYSKDFDYHSFIKLLSIYAPKEDDKKGTENE